MENIEFIKKEIKKGNYKSAEEELNKLISNDKNNYHYYLLLGYTFEKSGNFIKAIENYQLSKKLNRSELITNNLANIYIKIKNFDEAIIELSESLKINNQNPITFNNYGLILILQKKENESIKFFKNAIALNPNYMDPKYNLLEILEKTSSINEFKKYITKEISNFPKDKILQFFYGVYLNLSKNNKKALEILESFKFVNYKENWEYRRLNLIGKINDEIGNYKSSFSSHLEANKFLINNFCLDLFNEKKYLRKLINLNNYLKKDNINNIDVQKNKTSLFFLVGFPRSGTTLLDAILSSHSKLKVIEEKPILEETLKKISLKDQVNCEKINNKKLREIYYSNLLRHISKNEISNKIIIDKMPLNFIYSNAIYNIFPEAKIIFCLRHPLDSILSCFFQNFVLNEAMVNFLDLKRTAELYSLSMEIFNSYKKIPSKNILLFKYEDLVSNFDREVHLICNFMNIKTEKNMNEFYNNVSNKERVRTASYNQVNKPIYQNSKFRWLNYKNELSSIINIVDKWVKYYDY